jgi:membrane protein DedA with SNARE-associated domain/membrane-associated phospholipid phosphatase
VDTGPTQALLDWLAHNPGWAGLLIFLVAWIESLVVIGIVLPGIFILFGIGAMIGLGALEFYPVWLAASAGALLGDVVSFVIGFRLREHLADFWPFSRYPAMLTRGKRFFHQHGAKSVFAGRFVGPLRPVIPATAGMLAMEPRRFLGVAVPACILWAPAYLLPGMLFGASLEVAAEYTGRLSLVLVILVVMLWLTWWLIRGSYEFLVSRSARWVRRAITWARRHPVVGRITGSLLDPSQPELLSVSMLGLLLVLFVWAFAMILLLSPFSQQPQAVDQAVLELAQTLRNHIADPVMVFISQLSRWSVLLPTAAAVLLWLLGAARYSAAVHWLVAMGGGVVLQFLLSWTLRATPLLQQAASLETWRPSPAMTMTAVVLGFFSIMIAKELPRRSRQWPYLATALLLTLLLLARVYLGLDWLSGALAGLLLGLAWTAIVGIGYRQRALLPFSGAVASAIFFGMLTISMNLQVRDHLSEDLESLRLALPVQPVDANAWWLERWEALPRELPRFSSVAARQFNFQVAADPGDFAAALASAGWYPDSPADWTWLIQALNPNPDPAALSLLGKDHLGRPEVLRLRRFDGVSGSHQTLRLWDSGARLEPGGRILYLGQLAEERLVRRLRLIYYWRSMPAEPAMVEQVAEALDGLEVRRVEPGLLLVREAVAD